MSACRVCEAPTDGFMCRPCGGQLERAIAEMPSLFHEMSVLATGQARVYRANGKAEPDEEHRYDPEADLTAFLRSPHGRTALRPTRLMVNLDARETAWIAGNTLTSWARHLAESRGAKMPMLGGTTRRRLYVERNRMHVHVEQIPSSSIAPLIGWLLSNITSMRMDEAAAEMHDEITTVHRQMVGAVDRSPSRVYAGPCHAPAESGRCQLPLYGWPGADTLECDGFGTEEAGCEAAHTTADRADWLRDTVQEVLVGLDEMLEALPTLFPDYPTPPRSVVQSWVRQGRLMAHGQNHVGEPTFVGGELLDLVANYRPHRFAPRRKRSAA